MRKAGNPSPVHLLTLCLTVIWPILAMLSFAERLWDGVLFLGFACYVSPENRWYRGEDGEWRDDQWDMAMFLRPSLTMAQGRLLGFSPEAFGQVAGYSTEELSEAEAEIDDFLRLH